MASKRKKLSSRQVLVFFGVLAVLLAGIGVYAYLSNAGGGVPASAPVPEGKYLALQINQVYKSDLYTAYRKKYGACYFASSTNPNYYVLNLLNPKGLGQLPYTLNLAKSSVVFVYDDAYAKGAVVRPIDNQNGTTVSATVFMSRKDKSGCFAPLPPDQSGKGKGKGDGKGKGTNVPQG